PYDFDSAVTKGFTLYAKWNEEEEIGGDDGDDSEIGGDSWKNPYTDIKPGDWYYDAIQFVTEKGWFNGTGSTKFGPDYNTTRGMIVTILYRIEGEPETSGTTPFVDVDMKEYYGNPVSWAEANHVVEGISVTHYAPEQNVLREQLAAILYRYANLKGYDTSVADKTDLSKYADADKISPYAVNAMKYAIGSGLMNGKSATVLDPQAEATRAELAVMLQRFFEINK
ncbi:MAG: S-layer homology domain-containing protein, partial [Oscillospiraceae bacterium]|nr:S-layer homology domain-containing protein [Oscillospiraceae bacterium]